MGSFSSPHVQTRITRGSGTEKNRMADTELVNSEAVEGTSMELFWGK